MKHCKTVIDDLIGLRPHMDTWLGGEVVVTDAPGYDGRQPPGSHGDERQTVNKLWDELLIKWAEVREPTGDATTTREPLFLEKILDLDYDLCDEGEDKISG